MQITKRGERLVVPERPEIPFIEGDGIGKEITPYMQQIVDAAVGKAYGESRKIEWREVLAGEKAFNVVGSWLPQETIDTFRTHLVGIKGPLTTPVGEGIRSLNVALRQELDLYVCLRPVRWFKGVATPLLHPEKVHVTIFRENTEDIYAGIEWAAGTPELKKVLKFLKEEMGVAKIRFPETNLHRDQAGVGGGYGTIGSRGYPVCAGKPAAVSHAGTQRQHHEVYRGRL